LLRLVLFFSPFSHHAMKSIWWGSATSNPFFLIFAAEEKEKVRVFSSDVFSFPPQTKDKN